MSAVITQRFGSIFNENRNRLFMVIAIALMMLIAVMVTDSHAKGGPCEGNSPEISEWFSSQHNALGGWCCNDADGHRYYGDYVLNSDGSVTISPGTPDAHQIESYKVLSRHKPDRHRGVVMQRGTSRHKDHILLRAGIADLTRL
ncbi:MULTISPECIES: hypothetical protein [unclassified Bradyrhizobium]|uniref:hypothetical protein n=1 Tax=unclassified Bradyrhizobium TaxID=2631580 RepID=UPI000550680D|nr:MULTISPECIES: hypothetical protein [unclassified Bradyrhizobium]MCP3467016.1 hypothetical protein [Bradyrhizobium sp. CCGUVB23]